MVEQVDLTPTLALGLGLPISQNSVGRVIPGVLEETSLRDQLRFLHLNGHQLSCLLKDSMPDYEKGGLLIHRVQPLDSLKPEKPGPCPHYAELFKAAASTRVATFFYACSNVTIANCKLFCKFKE